MKKEDLIKETDDMTIEELVALAKVGITAVIDEATGYQKERFKDKQALAKVYAKAVKKEKKC